MAGPFTMGPEKSNTETRVRFDGSKSQSCGCLRGRVDHPARSTSGPPSYCRQDDDSYDCLAKAQNNRKESLRGLCERQGTDNGDEDLRREERLNMDRAHHQDQYNLLRDLRKKERIGRDQSGALKELDFGEECHDNAGGHRHGQKHTAGNLFNKGVLESLGGHFFRKEERIKLHHEEFLRARKNDHPLSRILRRESKGSGGSPLCDSHSSSRSRSALRRSNDDCPQMLNSRSGSPSSSRCITPRQLRRSHSRTLPFRQAFVRHRASRSDDPAPEGDFRNLSGDETNFSPDSTRSKSQPPQSRGPLCKGCHHRTAATPQRSLDKTKAPVPRRMTLIERYQSAYSLQKSSTQKKGSSLDRQKSRPCSRSGAMPGSSGKDPAISRESYCLRKSEEGLTPLRSPWREVPEASPYEDPRSLQSCNEHLLPNDLQRRNYRQTEQYNPLDTDRRRESSHCVAPQTLKESSRHDDHSDNNFYPSSNYRNNSQLTRRSKNCRCPQKTSYMATELPHAWNSKSSYDNANATRESYQHDDPETTRGSFTCIRPCLASNEYSSANDGLRPTRNPSCENASEIHQTTKDSSRNIRPHLAKKDSSSANDDRHTARNFSGQISISQTTNESFRYPRSRLGAQEISPANDDPHTTARKFAWKDKPEEYQSRETPAQFDNPPGMKESFRCSRPRLATQELSSARDDLHTARKPSCQNEPEESREASAYFDNPHDVRASWRQNDLYEVRGSEVFRPFSAREILDDPVSTTDSWWTDKERRPTQDSRWLSHKTVAERDMSSTSSEPPRDSRRPDPKTASKLDDLQRDSWRQSNPPKARQIASTYAETHIERGTWLKNNSDAARKFSTYNDSPLEPRANLRYDNSQTPISQPCYRSQEDDFSLSVSSRHYGKPPRLHKESPTQQSDSTHRCPASTRRSEKRRNEVEDSISPLRPR